MSISPTFDDLGLARLLEELSRPLHTPVPWVRRSGRKGEASLASGLWLDLPPEVSAWPGMENALSDFLEFLACQQIPVRRADLQGRVLPGLRLQFKPLPADGAVPAGADEHRIIISAGAVTVESADAAGFRRAMVWLEDEMLARGGPFLPLGTDHRRAAITTRISRCFFGPIQRPPFNRNELADEVDYYPESYLNRLAHDGVTALWITVKFKESVPSALFPEFGASASQHLAKLRRTVEKCRRYHIRIYVFCIEPAALPIDSPIFKRHPELKGHVRDDFAAFCVSSEIGQAYLEEAGRTLFEEVPGLGGLIFIPVGERFTHCASIFLPQEGSPHPPINCPRCRERSPYAVVHDVLAGFRRGMDQVDPSAELIAWPYGQMVCWGAERTIEAAGHLPPGVVLQHNFESGGKAIQLGRQRPLWDYWLSWVGPSPIFAEAAHRVRARGGRISAKLQVGNSHELATVPFIPVPGLLYRKYAAMHQLGVSSAMQSWYFGNYPSLMTRAAGLLSFSPLPATESDFLLYLARREWGQFAPSVAKAWALFGRAYENYPATHFFGYYGPVQNGVTWPLHLIPRRRPLSPTWKMDFPPGGDYLADCLSSNFTLDEAVTLCRRMERYWKQGMRHLRAAFERSGKTPAQTHEIQVSEAVGLHFENASAILHFYELRETLVDAVDAAKRLSTLALMEEIVKKELVRRGQFLKLLKKEPTLGYHSEAEGFKVTPKLVEEGVAALKELLAHEFPEVRQRALSQKPWFTDYTGQLFIEDATARNRELKGGDRLLLRRGKASPWVRTADPGVPLQVSPSAWRAVPVLPIRHWLVQGGGEASPHGHPDAWETPRRAPVDAEASFRALLSNKELAFLVDFATSDPTRFGLADGPWRPTVLLDLEPERLRPRVEFQLEAGGPGRSLRDDGYLPPQPLFSTAWAESAHGWQAAFAIPLSSIGLPTLRRPFRLAVRIAFFERESGERRELSWMARTPLPARLAWGDLNPATDYGWVNRSGRGPALRRLPVSSP